MLGRRGARRLIQQLQNKQQSEGTRDKHLPAGEQTKECAEAELNGNSEECASVVSEGGATRDCFGFEFAGADGECPLSSLLSQTEEQPQTDKQCARKFFVMKEGSVPGEVYRLPHPRSNSPTLYMINQHGDTFELMSFDHGGNAKRSCFFGDSLISDGSVLMFSPVHPLFLVIGHLQRKAKDRFLSLEDIFDDSYFPVLKKLSASSKMVNSMKMSSDWEVDGNDSIKFRYSEERLLDWLEDRFRILINSLIANCGETYEQNGSLAKNHSFEILADYLPDSISELLESRLNLKMDQKEKIVVAKKRIFAESIKVTKSEETPSKKRVTKLLAEASKGTQSLKSFFGASKPFDEKSKKNDTHLLD